MKTSQQKSRPAVVIAIFAVCALVICGALWARREHSQPAAQERQVMPVQAAVLPVKETVKADDGVAPETEAALNRFGLSAKHLSPLVLTAKSRPPIVIAAATQKTNNQ